jgi:hypothetical protein
VAGEGVDGGRIVDVPELFGFCEQELFLEQENLTLIVESADPLTM